MSGQSFPDPDDIQDSTFRSCEGAITAKEELLDVEKDVVDGHLHFHDEGVASLFIIDDKEPLEVEVSEEGLEVRATVPTATSWTKRLSRARDTFEVQVHIIIGPNKFSF